MALRSHLLPFAIVALLLAVAGHADPGELRPALCEVVIHEERSSLENYRLAVDVARSDFAAYERIFAMIEELWKADAVNRMDYIEARYDRDAARLALEQADLILARQSELVEQYRLICQQADSDDEEQAHVRTLRESYLRYRRADCSSLAKAAEVAATNLEFNREYLASILDLQQKNVATKVDVIRAELDVEREEQRLSDAKRRATECKAELGRLEGGAGL
jgi:outer membrane protein TolC